MRIRAALSACLGLLLTAGLAHAEGDENGPSPASVGKPTRRSDFTLGFSGGLALGRASGYPNEIDQIGVKAYRSNTKLGLGNGLPIRHQSGRRPVVTRLHWSPTQRVGA